LFVCGLLPGPCPFIYNSMGTHLFVYGLFRDSARPLLGNFVFVGRDSVSGQIFRVNDSYPGFVRGSDGQVWGDVYLVDESVLPALDEFEGGEFERRRIVTALGHECWIYEFVDEVGGARRIRGGDWMLR
jgi:gamma-glutamylcyclotransferase (GGCT)/AIG2-like uncharacterized protein YtfP